MQVYTLHREGILDHPDFVAYLVKNLREATFEEIISLFDYEETFTICTLLAELLSIKPEIKMENDAKECMLVGLINEKLSSYIPVCHKCKNKKKSSVTSDNKSDKNKIKEEEEHFKDSKEMMSDEEKKGNITEMTNDEEEDKSQFHILNLMSHL